MELKDIDKLAILGRLDIPQEEKETFLRDLTAIIGYVDQIQSVSIDMNTEVHIPAHRNIFREDCDPHDTGSYTDALVKNMPDHDGTYLKVPRIL
jgi:aspartyl-tRNA(Asn)/glutamyl-tRNA(Gln) amidotransferase subunit C